MRLGNKSRSLPKSVNAPEEMYLNCRAVAGSTVRRAGVLALMVLCPLLLSGSNATTRQETSPQKQGTPTDSSAGLGRLTFESICASCHWLDGRGCERVHAIASRTIGLCLRTLHSL